MKDIITIAPVNFHVFSGEKDRNAARMEGFIRAAAKRGADLVLFPELCVMGYDYYLDPDTSAEERLATAETPESDLTRHFAGLAQELGIFVVYTAAENGGGKLYNTAFLIDDSGRVSTYRKIHPYAEENSAFAKGDQPLLWETPWGPVGIGICYDSYQFPELMRYYVAKGARLYLNPTAEAEEIRFEGSRRSFENYYRRNLEYGAASNGIFIASANLTGWDKFTYFAGGSVILGPKTDPFTETDACCFGGSFEETQEKLIVETIDLALASRMLMRENSFGSGTDYRGELYKSW